MRRMRSPSRAACVAFTMLFGSATLAVPASAGEPNAGSSNATRCIGAAERGQRERDEGHLLQSRTTFASCGEEACPDVVRRECVRWLAEVEDRIPSILVSVQDEGGRDVVDAAVTIDGRPMTAANRGREVTIDPGLHRIAVRREGMVDLDTTIVAREREKGRTVRLVFAPVQPKTNAAPASASSSARHGPPLFTWILAGTAVLGGASFGYFYSKGVDKVHELRASCAPRCADGDVDDASQLLSIAHLSLGIGIAAAASAVLVYVLQPDAQPSTASVSTAGLRF